MKMNGNKTNGGFNRLLNQLAADRKKFFIAAALIVLMVFMWVRLLGGEGPQSAHAATTLPVTAGSVASAAVKVRSIPVALPYIEGRHNVLARDFFRIDGQFSGAAGASIVSTDTGKDGVREVAQGLRLDAISTGPQPEAFINDRLVKVGDTIVVEGSKRYPCQVMSISANSVIVKYEEIEIELKLKQPD
jgi:hypothetical protein